MRRFKRFIALVIIGGVCSVSSCVEDMRAILVPDDRPCLTVVGQEFCWTEGV